MSFLKCECCGEALEPTVSGYGLCPQGKGKLKVISKKEWRELCRVHGLIDANIEQVVKRVPKGASCRHAIDDKAVTVKARPRTAVGVKRQRERGRTVAWLGERGSMEVVAVEPAAASQQKTEPTKP